MVRLTFVTSLASLVLAACGGDDGPAGGAPDADPAAIDAAPTPYGCIGRAHPTTAPAMITVAGVTNEINTDGQVPLDGVALTVADSDDTTLTTGTSDGSGNYSVTVSTGGAPVDGYIQGTTSNYKETYVYPPAPLANDQASVPVLLVSNTVWSFLPLIANATQDNTEGFLGVLVSDCLGNPVEGATVTSPAAETVRYVEGTGVGDETVTVTDSSGIALLFNVTPGDTVMVDASTPDHDFEAHPVKVRANVVTTTVVAPGPIPGLAP